MSSTPEMRMINIVVDEESRERMSHYRMGETTTIVDPPSEDLLTFADACLNPPHVDKEL